MAKTPTFPLILDRCYTVSIGDMKRWGSLVPGQYKSGSVYWERAGSREASVGYFAFISREPGQAYIQFNYTCDGEQIQWRVPLLSVPSNLGKGLVWFFRCPVTGKRCKKLHFIDRRFMHRSAVRGAMYKRQTESKKYRKLNRFFDAYEIGADVLAEMEKPYFKEEYQGKPTRRCLRLIRKAERVERRVNVREVFRLFR
ncbi:MAG: hypothetical protein R3D58_09790 [Saprospiraceae bacterium]